jgi:hypothetical protein
MSAHTSVKNGALKKLLAGLFPNVALSNIGVALLGAQLDGLEKKRARLRQTNGHNKSREHPAKTSNRKPIVYSYGEQPR